MWTQLELVYSFLTAAIPPLVKMSAELNTGVGRNMIEKCVIVTQMETTNHMQSSDYELQVFGVEAIGTTGERRQSSAGSEERILGNDFSESCKYEPKLHC
jgi:hypothetical protein